MTCPRPLSIERCRSLRLSWPSRPLKHPMVPRTARISDGSDSSCQNPASAANPRMRSCQARLIVDTASVPMAAGALSLRAAPRRAPPARRVMPSANGRANRLVDWCNGRDARRGQPAAAAGRLRRLRRRLRRWSRVCTATVPAGRPTGSALWAGGRAATRPRNGVGWPTSNPPVLRHPRPLRAPDRRGRVPPGVALADDGRRLRRAARLVVDRTRARRAGRPGRRASRSGRRPRAATAARSR